jgi:two-component system, chemotaxis family, CheB/CheR fusion protein
MEQLYPLNILIAEDTPIIQKSMKFLLTKIGYTPDIANNGLEVLELLNQKDYDLIFMDMQMPEMDGVTTTKIIRQELKLPIWIVAMTGNTLERDRQICLDVGMNDYICKPVLMEAILKAFENYHSYHQHY